MLTIDDMRRSESPIPAYALRTLLERLGYQSQMAGGLTQWTNRGLTINVEHADYGTKDGITMVKPEQLHEIGAALQRHMRILEKGRHPERYPTSQPKSPGTRGI